MDYRNAFKTNEGRIKILEVYDRVLAQWPAHETKEMETACGSTFIIRCGSTDLPPLILLHGSSSNSVFWMQDAARYSENFCVYAVDMPGEPGRSEERQYSISTAVYFEWLNEVTEKLGLGMFSLVGISLGAWMAAGFAVRYPEKVQKLVLICPSGIGGQKISFILKAILLLMLGDRGIDMLSRMVNGSQKMPGEALDYVRLIAKNFNARTEPVPIFSDEELKKLTMPVLLFAGDRDVILNSKQTITRINMLLPHAKSYLLKDRGHVLIGLEEEIASFLLV